MPYPIKKESKEDYIKRFMSSKEAIGDYSDEKQRYAVALSMWKKKGKSIKKSVRIVLKIDLVKSFNKMGKRDGTGPYKDSYQSLVNNIGKKRESGEKCPIDKKDKKKNIEKKNIEKKNKEIR